MASLNLRSFKIAPGHQEIVGISGDYVRVQKSLVPLWVETENGDKFDLVEGEEAQISKFTRLSLSHDDLADQNIRIFIGDGARVGSSKLSGNVAVPGGVNINNWRNVSAGEVNKATVTTVAVDLLPAQLGRAWLVIENQHSVGTVWINFDATAVAGSGLELGPGQKLSFTGGICPYGRVSAIGDAVSNGNIVIGRGGYD